MNSMPSELSYTEQVQSLVTFLIREPVAEAVRAALREEGVTATSDHSSATVDAAARSDETEGGAASKVAVGILAIAIVALAYRMRGRTTGGSGDTVGLENRVTGPNSDTDGATRPSPPAE